MLKALFLSVVCGSRPVSMAELISQARRFGRAVVTEDEEEDGPHSSSTSPNLQQCKSLKDVPVSC